jgi:hypothetical protein
MKQKRKTECKLQGKKQNFGGFKGNGNKRGGLAVSTRMCGDGLISSEGWVDKLVANPRGSQKKVPLHRNRCFGYGLDSDPGRKEISLNYKKMD